MSRSRDADKMLARGSVPGTRAGRGLVPSPSTATGSAKQVPPPPRDAVMTLGPLPIPRRLDATWMGAALVVAVVYILLLHRVPWFIALALIGRAAVALFAGRRHWIALTPSQLQVLEDDAEPWSVPRAEIASVHINREGSRRIEFMNAAGGSLLSAPRLYDRRQVARLAAALEVPLLADAG